MVEFYKILYIGSLVIGIILVVTSIILFFKINVFAVIKELKDTKQENDIKKLLQNTVLLNPQIQEDLPNIEGYNDLLAYYFKVLKEEEKKKEQLLKKLEEHKEEKKEIHIKIPTYKGQLVNVFKSGERLDKYCVEFHGTSIIVK